MVDPGARPDGGLLASSRVKLLIVDDDLGAHAAVVALAAGTSSAEEQREIGGHGTVPGVSFDYRSHSIGMRTLRHGDSLRAGPGQRQRLLLLGERIVATRGLRPDLAAHLPRPYGQWHACGLTPSLAHEP
jgi:hypothetical protein